MSASVKPFAEAHSAGFGRIPISGRRPVAPPTEAGDGIAALTGPDAAPRAPSESEFDASPSPSREDPPLRRTRAERVALAIEAARTDPEFQREVAAADAARDAGDWPRAEFLYWRALQMHPLHAGYMVQYGHMLKEQGKLPDAEVIYRSARGLGAAPRDVDEHILYVQAVLGHAAPLPPPVAEAAAHPLDLPPTRDDVEAMLQLFLHRGPTGIGELLDLLRAAPTRRAVALSLVRADAFRPANRALMILLAEQG